MCVLLSFLQLLSRQVLRHVRTRGHCELLWSPCKQVTLYFTASCKVSIHNVSTRVSDKAFITHFIRYFTVHVVIVLLLHIYNSLCTREGEWCH